MKIKFWGVRGSIPTPGINTSNIGGNTSCVTIEGDIFSNRFIVLDGGTGIREFGIDILKNHQFFNGNQVQLNFDIFFLIPIGIIFMEYLSLNPCLLKIMI